MEKHRFFSNLRAADNGCLEWTGYTMPPPSLPYGRLRVGDHKELAHRHAYRLAHGDIPAGMCVCHRCDNPRCCNPVHLFLGTQIENIADMDRKARRNVKPPIVRGERVGGAKLTEASVLEIRRIREEEGLSTVDLGKRFGVSHSVISRVINRKTWTHI